MKKDRYALIDLDGNIKLTGDSRQELEQALNQSIERLRTDAGELRKVAKGIRASYRGIADPTEAGQAFMRMMAQADQRKSWAVIENI